jgi:hypothetical protein
MVINILEEPTVFMFRVEVSIAGMWADYIGNVE